MKVSVQKQYFVLSAHFRCRLLFSRATFDRVGRRSLIAATSRPAGNSTPMDKFTRAQRSALMAQIKAKDTVPEWIVRRAAHSLGYRFRLHRKDLPGRPDLVFANRRKAIFVNGCFWHGHNCPRGSRKPATNTEYWVAKIARNVLRDRNARSALRALKWQSLSIWECQLRDEQRLRARLRAFLGD